MTIPTGTLTRKIQRQPTRPGDDPAEDEPGRAADGGDPRPGRDRALARSPSGNASTIIASADGATSAAPSPCTARATTSTAAVGASPHASDAAVNSAKPPMKTRRRPNASAIRPATSRQPAKTST